jgi:hypothetical protein
MGAEAPGGDVGKVEAKDGREMRMKGRPEAEMIVQSHSEARPLATAILPSSTHCGSEPSPKTLY